MSVLTAMAPRPLEAISSSEMNIDSSRMETGDRKAQLPSAPAAAAAVASTPTKRKADEIEEIEVDDDDDDDDDDDKEQSAGGQKRLETDVSKEDGASPSKGTKKAQKESKKAAMSPEQLAKAAERDEKRKEREAKKAEKAKKEAEKEAKRQKEVQRQKRAANFMSNFIVPKKASPIKPHQPTATSSLSDFQRAFPPCNYKDMAPANRFQRKVDEQFDQNIFQSTSTGQDHLQELLARSNRYPRPSSSSRPTRRLRRKGIHAPVSVRETMRLITEAGVTGDERLEENGKRGMAKLADRKRVPIKLLHFATDRRPAWYGTWTRSSNLIGPRRPLGQDPVAIDYSVDSDAEWEEFDPMDGDDVHDNENEEEDRNSRSDSDSEMEDWLVDDLEEEEGEDEVKRIKPIGRRFDKKLVPFETGPHWEDQPGVATYEGFRTYQMEMLNDALPGLNPFTYTQIEEVVAPPPSTVKPSLPAAESPSARSAETPLAAPLNGASGPGPSPIILAKASVFPAEHLARLLKLVEGNAAAVRPILVEELRAAFADVGKNGVAKTTLDACLTVYAEKLPKKAGGKWAIRQQYRSLVPDL